MTSVPSPRPVLWYTWVHGHENYHTEAMAMLLSCVAQKSPRARLRVYTDQPKWYAWLAPHVEVHVLSEAQMEQWGSKSDYLPRIKAKLIEKVSAEFEGPTIWLDTDMWAVQSLAPLEELLDEGHPLMHFDESVIAKGSHGTDVSFRSYFLLRNPELLPRLHQYNSGVVGLPMGWSKRATQALHILDDMEKHGVKDWTREQMAFSVPLAADGNLCLAESFFRHYCGGKQRAAWQPLLKRALFQMVIHHSQPEAIAVWMRSLPAGEIPPPGHRRLSWIEKKRRSLKKRFGLSLKWVSL